MFNFNFGKIIDFVCQSGEYKSPCTKLGCQFENFEKEPYEKKSVG